MGTSESHERTAGAWTATAHLFSGRPDPQWRVSADEAAYLRGLWEQLPETKREPSVPFGLGYRGVSLAGPDGDRWRAYGGAVTMRTPLAAATRRDEGRAWERCLLSTAPSGLLPPLDIPGAPG